MSAYALRARSAQAPCEPSAMLDQLLAWLNGRFARDDVRFAPRTPLFEDGLIDSIRVLELIAWTERAIGREIADVDIRMDNFRTPARIVAVFAGVAESDADDA